MCYNQVNKCNAFRRIPHRKELSMVFYEKIYQLRRAVDLTQDEFAARIGVSRQTVSKWESGTAYPDLKNLQTLCDFFEISPDLLLNDARAPEGAEEGSYPIDFSSLGNCIRNLRIARDIGQEQLAELLGVSRQSVSKWENGAAIPKTELLLDLARVLNTDLSKLLPPVPTGEEQAPFGPLARRKKWLPLVLIPTLSLLLAVITVGAILSLPMALGSPVDTVLNELFFDAESVAHMTERWEAEGVELTLGEGESKLALKVKVDDTAVTVGGLSSAPVSLPRQNVKAAMEASAFHPQSGSPMALSHAQYQELLSILETLEKEPEGSLSADGIEKTIEDILNAVSEKLTPQVEYRLAKGRFALEKTVTCEADLPLLAELLRVVAEELKKNGELNGILKDFSMIKPSEWENTGGTLDALLATSERQLTEFYTDRKITLSYTVVAGRLTGFTLTDHATDKEKIAYATLCTFTVNSDDASAGFTLTVSNTVTLEGVSTTEEIEYVYKKTSTDSGVELLFTVEGRSRLGNEDMSESYSSKETHSLSYSKTDKTFVYRYKAPEWDSESLMEGVWELNTDEGMLRFGISKWQEDGETLLETSAAVLSLRALGEETLSEGEALLAMSGESLLAFYRQLPLKSLQALVLEVTGESLELAFSQEGVPMPPEAERLAMHYSDLFRQYNGSHEDGKNLPVKKIRIFHEGIGVYFLLDQKSSVKVTVTYAEALNEAQITGYHEAVLIGNALSVHHVEKAERVAPTCVQEGKQIYRCADCGKTYSVTLEKIEHRYVENSMSVVTDDGVARNAHWASCKNCGDCFQVDIDGYCTFYVEPGFTGLRIADYVAARNSSHFSVPDALAKELSLDSLRLEEGSSYHLIRIPEGVSRVTLNSFTYLNTLQVLILPASLTQIESGALANMPMLHTVYYHGTEEQWNALKLGRYRDEWKNLDIIFCPDGVTPETAFQGLFTEEKKTAALEAAKKKTESQEAAQAFAEANGAWAMDSGIVTRLMEDTEAGTVVILGAFADGKQTARVYSSTDFSLLSEITVAFEIVTIDAWGGRLALSGNGGEVYFYSQASGALEFSFLPFTDATVAVRRMVLMDGYLYFCNEYTVYARELSSGNTVKLLTANKPNMNVNRSLHRMVVYGTVNSPIYTTFVNTETAECITSHMMSPEFPWMDDFPYVTKARSSPTYYDLDGKLLKNPPTVSAVELTLSNRERLCSTVLKTDRCNVTLCCDVKGTVYLLVKMADGTLQRLDYYATSARLLSNGILLLYTEGGHGVVAVRI